MDLAEAKRVLKNNGYIFEKSVIDQDEDSFSNRTATIRGDYVTDSNDEEIGWARKSKQSTAGENVERNKREVSILNKIASGIKGLMDNFEKDIILKRRGDAVVIRSSDEANNWKWISIAPSYDTSADMNGHNGYLIQVNLDDNDKYHDFNNKIIPGYEQMLKTVYKMVWDLQIADAF